jgi:hypothetical protein
MKVSDIAGAQLSELKQTLSMNVFKSAQATATAHAVTMLDDFQKVQKTVDQQTIKPVPHPYAGQHIDVKG